MSVLVVGSVALDDVQTWKGKRESVLGGSATYFSLAASPWCRSKIVAVVGEDFPQRGVDCLKNVGADLSGLTVVDGGKTFRWGGVYADDFSTRTTTFTDLNVFADFNPTLPESYRDSQYVLLANIQPSLQARVLDQLSNPAFVAMDTMNLWINTAREDLNALLPRVDLLVINDEESHLLTGEYNIFKAGPKIQAMGPKFLIVKRGEHGATLFGPDGQTQILPAFPVERVVDPTGAGDSFAGGMMGYLAKRGEITFDTIKEAMVAGTLVASFLVEDFSVDRLVTLSKEELLDRYEQFRKLLWFPLWPDEFRSL